MSEHNGNYWIHRRLPRRRVLSSASLAVGAGATMALVGCGDDDDSTGSGAPAAGFTTIGAPGSSSPTASTASATAAATGTPVKGGVVSFSLGADPPAGNFDVQQSTATGALSPGVHIFNRLIRLGYGGKLQEPDLARTWEQPGPTEVVLKLQSDVKWHDGAAFTSADVVASLDRLRKPPQGVSSPRKAAFAVIDAIEAPDATTVRLKLATPSAGLIAALAGPGNAIYSKAVVDANTATTDKGLIGTGPFKFSKYDKGVAVTLVRNDSYWEKGLPYLDGVTFKIIADQTQQAAAFLTKQVLETGTQTGSAGKQLADKIRTELKDKAAVNQIYSQLPAMVLFNHAKKPLDDPRVRRALALAVNHKEYSDALGFGQARLSSAMAVDPWALPESEVLKLPGYDSSKKDKDLTDAKAALSAAGVSNLSLKLDFWTVSDYADAAALLKQVFSRIGVNITTQGSEGGAFNVKRDTGDYDLMYYIAGLQSTDPDEWMNTMFLTGAATNWQKSSDATLDAQLRAQAQELDATKRLALVQQIQKDLVTNYAPRVFLPMRPIWRGVYNDVKNYKVGPDLYGHIQPRDWWLES